MYVDDETTARLKMRKPERGALIEKKDKLFFHEIHAFQSHSNRARRKVKIICVD